MAAGAWLSCRCRSHDGLGVHVAVQELLSPQVAFARLQLYAICSCAHGTSSSTGRPSGLVMGRPGHRQHAPSWKLAEVPPPSIVLTHGCACCRAMLLAGDFFLGAVVAAALTKLILRLRTLGLSTTDLNRRTAEASTQQLLLPTCTSAAFPLSPCRPPGR